MNKVAKTSQPFEITSKFPMDLFWLSAQRANALSKSWEGTGRIAPAGTKTAKLFDLQPLKLSNSQSFNPTRPFPPFLIGWYVDQR